MKKSILIIMITVLAVLGAIVIYKFVIPNENNNQAKKFNSEYTLLDEDNVFVYKSLDEIIKILDSGTGIVFLGFPECPWCQEYVVHLNEIAKKHSVKEIYYYNIRTIRNDNTEKYKKIVSILEENLPTDDNGEKRVYVPNVTFVRAGKIIANDNETSLINDGTAIKDYWTEETTNKFNVKMDSYFEKYFGTCTMCN